MKEWTAAKYLKLLVKSANSPTANVPALLAHQGCVRAGYAIGAVVGFLTDRDEAQSVYLAACYTAKVTHSIWEDGILISSNSSVSCIFFNFILASQVLVFDFLLLYSSGGL